MVRHYWYFSSTFNALQSHVAPVLTLTLALTRLRPCGLRLAAAAAAAALFRTKTEGMSLDVKASRNDMVAKLHLDAVTVQDMARPQDSPFRHMMYTMPDETSHGGLIHVTYWESAGGVRRIPPACIAETGGQRYDQVVDARISTLQVRRRCPPTPNLKVGFRE